MNKSWRTKKLGEVADIYGGGTPRRSNSSYWGNDIPWLTMEDVNNNFEVAGTAQYISNQGLQNSNAQLVPAASVNLSCTASVGNVTINRIPLATNQQFNSFHPHQELLPEFLAYELIFRKREIETLGGTTTFPFISKTTISNFPVHIPPLSIQKQIVGRLDKIAEAQKLNDELIQKSDELFQSLLYKELNPAGKNWEVKKLGDIAETSSGGTPLKEKAEFYENGIIPWLRSGEVSQGLIYKSELFITGKGLKNSSAKIFPINTILVAMYGATAGQVGLLKFEASTNQAICGAFPSDKFIPEYLYYFLKTKTEYLIQISTGGAQPNISQQIIRNLKVPLPSLKIQKQIVAKLSAAQEYKKQLLEQKAKLGELFDSVLHKSMKGEYNHGNAGR